MKEKSRAAELTNLNRRHRRSNTNICTNVNMERVTVWQLHREHYTFLKNRKTGSRKIIISESALECGCYSPSFFQHWFEALLQRAEQGAVKHTIGVITHLVSRCSVCLIEGFKLSALPQLLIHTSVGYTKSTGSRRVRSKRSPPFNQHKCRYKRTCQASSRKRRTRR